jgi:hypothetical protein
MGFVRGSKESRTNSLGDDESCQTNSRSRDKACWEALIERRIPACPRTIGQAAARKAAALAGAYQFAWGREASPANRR